MHETISYLDVMSFICKLVVVYNCTDFLQTHVFDAIFCLLLVLLVLLVDTLCVHF